MKEKDVIFLLLIAAFLYWRQVQANASITISGAGASGGVQPRLPTWGTVPVGPGNMTPVSPIAPILTPIIGAISA